MSDAALLSDADVGLGGSSAPAAPARGVLSDEDVGLGGGSAPTASDTVQQRPYLDTLVRQTANAIPGMTHLAALGDTAVGYLPQSLKRYLPGNAVPGVTSPDQSGEPFTQRYSENLAHERGIDAADAAQYPITSVVAPLAASVAALPVAGPVDALSSGIAAAAPRLGGLAADSLASGVVGAGYGAAYGAGNANSLGEVLPDAATGATLGGIGGAAAPALVKGAASIGSAGAKLVKGITNPAGTGADLAAETIARDQASGLGAKMSPEQFDAASAAGQPVVAGDLGGEATRRLARTAANVSPEAKATLQDPLASRYASQNTRLNGFVDNLYGGDVDAEVMKTKLAQQAKGVITPAYEKAYAEGANGVWNPEASLTTPDGDYVPNLADLANHPNVQTAIKGASEIAKADAVSSGNQIVRNPFVTGADGNLVLKTNPDGSQAVPTLQFWDYVKRGLDAQRSAALRAGDNDAARRIGIAKNQLLTNLDQSVPSYATARQGAFQAFGADNALDAGANILKPSITPTQVQQAIAAVKTPLQRQALSYGAASAVVSKAVNASDGRDVVKLFDTPAIREKLQAAMDPDRFAQLEAYLRSEASMNLLKNAVSGNSTTAEQAHGIVGLATNALTSPVAGGLEGAAVAYHEHGFDPEEMLKYGAIGFMGGMMRKAYSGANAKMMQSVAENLASSDPAVARAAVARIAKNKQMMQALRRVSSHLASLPATAAGQMVGTQQTQ